MLCYLPIFARKFRKQMSLKPSESLDQISSARKDEFYLNFLRGNINDAIKKIFGPQIAIRWNKELQLIADVTYFGLTTLTELQTLGEEYTSIIQVGPSLNCTPSVLSRIIMIALHTVLPYFIDKFLCNIESQIAKNDNLSNNTNLQDIVQKVRLIFDVLNRLHLSVFYLHAIFHTMSKRFANVQYVMFALPGAQSHPDTFVFKVLGYMSLGQSLIALTMHLRSIYSDIKLFQNREIVVSKSENDETNAPVLNHRPDLKCSLCLEPRQHTTVTPCGHLFCWKCIHSWVNTKPECPICREKLRPNKLLYLRNYD